MVAVFALGLQMGITTEEQIEKDMGAEFLKEVLHTLETDPRFK